MCVLCVEIQKKNMTIREVASAYREFAIPSDHNGAVMVEIKKAYDLEEVAKELNTLYEEEALKAHESSRKEGDNESAD